MRWRYEVMDDYVTDLHSFVKSIKADAYVAYTSYNALGYGWEVGTYMAQIKFPGTISGTNEIPHHRGTETISISFNARILKAMNPIHSNSGARCEIHPSGPRTRKPPKQC